MGLYLLKRGSHAQGVIGNPDSPPRFYSAKKVDEQGNLNNIVESDQELDRLYPGRFEVYHGEAPERQMTFGGPVVKRGETPPPGPPTEMDYAEAAATKSMTVEEARKLAQRWREKAEALDRSAADAERNAAAGQEQTEEVAPSHTAPKAAPVKEAKADLPSDSELNQMSVEDLRSVAQDYNIPVKDNMKRADILHTIKANRK